MPPWSWILTVDDTRALRRSILPPNPPPNCDIYAPLLLSIINDEFSPPLSLIIKHPVVLVGVFIFIELFVVFNQDCAHARPDKATRERTQSTVYRTMICTVVAMFTA